MQQENTVSLAPPTKRKKLLRVCLALFVFGFVLLNLLAFIHARAMTHFSAGGGKTDVPEKLSVAQKARVLLTGVNVPHPINTSTPKDYQLEYETYTLRESTAPALEIWQINHAQSRGLILMFHGYGSSKETLLPSAKILHDSGYSCWLVDLRGCGGSGGNETSVGYFEAEDVARVFRKAAQDWNGKPVVLYGGSMGAVACMRAVAELGAKPAALMLECPFATLLSTVSARFHVMRLPPFPLAHLLVFWGGVQQGFNGFKLSSISYAGKVNCPVLVMQGADDARVSMDEANAISKAFRCSKKFKVFAKVGHESYAKAAPEEWRSTVEEFLLGL
jgi:alpha-beta hydrolase superfamily lysophospholipase